MKNCPLCGTENKDQAKACLNCAHPFTEETPRKAEKSEKKAQKTETPKPKFSYAGGGLIITPAGPPPCNPRNTENPTDDDLLDWANEIFSSGNYAPEAVLYFSQRFWPVGSETHKRLRAVLRL